MRRFFKVVFVDPRLRDARYLLALFLYATILIAGSIPDARAEVGEFASGFTLHFGAYASLAVLLFSGSSGSVRDRAIKSVLTIMAMGALDEFVQSFFSYRTAAFSDWLVDFGAGVCAAGMLAFVWPVMDVESA